MHVVRIRKCEHGRHAIMKKAWGGKHTGRRFLGCPMQDEADQCQFIEWLDEPWPERVQACLKELWKELKVTRRCEATANEALIDAIRCNDIATNARVELQEVNRTKRVVERVCFTYHRKAALTAVDKSKMMYLVYCLLGVIVFLVVAILFKTN
ncbi:uncharacterized protein [Miscanthus floridulus]